MYVLVPIARVIFVRLITITMIKKKKCMKCLLLSKRGFKKILVTWTSSFYDQKTQLGTTIIT